MRHLALVVLLAGCGNYPGTPAHSPPHDSGGSGVAAGAGGNDAGAGGGAAGAGGSTGGTGGDAGGSGGSGGSAEPGCGSLPPPCFALEAAFLLPHDNGVFRNSQLIHAVPDGGYNLVGTMYGPMGGGDLESLTVRSDGGVVQARNITDVDPQWVGAFVPDGFVVLLEGTGLPGRPELGSSRILARFGGGGELGWARAVDPSIPLGYGERDTFLPLANGDLLAFLLTEYGTEANPNYTYSIARWSADGTPAGEAEVGQWLDEPSLLQLADGRVLLRASNFGRATLVNYGALDPGTTLLEILPTLEARVLTRLSTSEIWNSVSLPDGAFAVSGPLGQNLTTTIGPGQANQVAYDAGAEQAGYLAVFEGDGTLRWSRRTFGQFSGPTVLGALPDGGVVARVSGSSSPTIEVGDGTSKGFPGERALAVFGPQGDLKVLQPEPAPGENEYGMRFDTASLTLFTQGDLFYEVTLGAGQPRQTSLVANSGGGLGSMAVYRYLDH